MNPASDKKKYTTVDTRIFSSGISLIEIMVGMAVAMIASLVVVQVFSVSEGFRRNSAGSSDVAQQGAILSTVLGTAVQNAGSGLTRANWVWGCSLTSDAATPKYPLTAALAAPFNIVPTTIRVAPLLVFDGGNDALGRPASDVVQLMGGSSANSNRWVDGAVAGNSVNLASVALGYQANDYLLLVARTAGAQVGVTAPGTCQLTRIAATYTQTFTTTTVEYGAKLVSAANSTLPLSATFGAIDASITGGEAASVLNQGGTPDWSLIGVDSDGALLSVDLMVNPATRAVLGENVFKFKVLYGVDTNNDDVIDSWVRPLNTYAASALVGGTATDEAKLSAILAVRLGLVLKTADVKANIDTPTSVGLFSDTAQAMNFALSTDEQRFQYQVYDWVVPLRNVKRYDPDIK